MGAKNKSVFEDCVFPSLCCIFSFLKCQVFYLSQANILVFLLNFQHFHSVFFNRCMKTSDVLFLSWNRFRHLNSIPCSNKITWGQVCCGTEHWVGGLLRLKEHTGESGNTEFWNDIDMETIYLYSPVYWHNIYTVSLLSWSVIILSYHTNQSFHLFALGCSHDWSVLSATTRSSTHQ